MTKATAVFKWWECWSKFIQPIPYFDILDPDHALPEMYHGSTVSDMTLKELGIEVPIYPSVEVFKANYKK